MKKILTIMLIVTAFVGCKKGEEDPIISLRSRDARITGTWELKKMEVKCSFSLHGNPLLW